MPLDYDLIHKRKLDKKWKSLIKRGIKPPESAEENRKRMKAAHGY